LVLLVANKTKWGIKNTFWALLASLLPFGTFVADRKIFSKYVS
jgi:integral membrane protein